MQPALPVLRYSCVSFVIPYDLFIVCMCMSPFALALAWAW